MIATRLLALAIHSLLHDSPMPVVGDDETLEVELEPVLNGGTV